MHRRDVGRSGGLGPQVAPGVDHRLEVIEDVGAVRLRALDAVELVRERVELRVDLMNARPHPVEDRRVGGRFVESTRRGVATPFNAPRARRERRLVGRNARRARCAWQAGRPHQTERCGAEPPARRSAMQPRRALGASALDVAQG
jgi:hypothetical protein